MTTNFYAPPDAIRQNRVILPDDEARHATQVLRKGEGEEIVVVDGEGGWYRVRLDHMSDDQVVGTIQETRREVGEPSYRLTIGVGILKKRSRFETWIEKGVELGVSTIIPLRTDRVEKETARLPRLRRVARAAMKQSRRSRCPRLTEPQSLNSVLEKEAQGLRLIAHAGEAEAQPIGRVLNASIRDILILVGPEGGFTEAEVRAAQEAGSTVVALGPRRLRTETAAIAAAAAVQQYHHLEHSADSS